jgi:hypothetical protein
LWCGDGEVSAWAYDVAQGHFAALVGLVGCVLKAHPSSRPVFGMERPAVAYCKKGQVEAAAWSIEARGLECRRVRWAGVRSRSRVRGFVCVIHLYINRTAGRIGDFMTTELEDVDSKIQRIRRNMPVVYESIREKAVVIGNEAYRLVRSGLRGQPNCFYAFENGHVVGTPFTQPDDVMPIVGKLLLNYEAQFGLSAVIVWPDSVGGSNGAS